MATHEELVEFINNHETQLITSGIPKIYWTKLCEKLKQEVSYPILIMIFRINMVLFKTIFFKLEYLNTRLHSLPSVRGIKIADGKMRAWTYSLTEVKTRHLHTYQYL